MYTGQEDPWSPGHVPDVIVLGVRPDQPFEPGSVKKMQHDIWNVIGRCWEQDDARRPTIDVALSELTQILSTSAKTT